MPKKTAEDPKQQEINVGMSIDPESGEVIVDMSTSGEAAADEVEATTTPVEGDTDQVAEETTEEVTEDSAPPVQTEMFVKSELDDATAVLSHLKAEQKKRLKAVETAEKNLEEIEQRVDEQKRVIARIQSQMPAAKPTSEAAPEEDDGLCRGKACDKYTFDGGPEGTDQYRCESLESDLDVVVAGKSPCPEFGKEETADEDGAEEVPESDITIEMDESDDDWMGDGDDGEEA